MLDAGISLQSARKAVESLRGFDEDLASVRIVLQGPNVVLAQSDEQVMDLLRGGQGVLSMVLELEPLQQTITEAVQLAFDTGAATTATATPAPPRGRALGSCGARHRKRSAPARGSSLRAQLRAPIREAPRLLSIVWEYEPRTFTLEHDREGRPVQAFTPDFYLPAYDLYIEITTLNQKLVTKKNRKARRLVEQHPDVSIRVLYQRDYLHLLVKYGLEPPSQLVDVEGNVDAGGSAPRRSISVAGRVPSRAVKRPRAHDRRAASPQPARRPAPCPRRAAGAVRGLGHALAICERARGAPGVPHAGGGVRRLPPRHGRMPWARRVLVVAVVVDERSAQDRMRARAVHAPARPGRCARGRRHHRVVGRHRSVLRDAERVEHRRDARRVRARARRTPTGRSSSPTSPRRGPCWRCRARPRGSCSQP